MLPETRRPLMLGKCLPETVRKEILSEYYTVVLSEYY